jgi:hypothetical protein
MDDPVGDVVVFDKVKDLRLVDVPCISPGMDDTVCIARVRGPDVIGFPVIPAQSVGTGGCKRGKKRFMFSDVGADRGIGRGTGQAL